MLGQISRIEKMCAKTKWRVIWTAITVTLLTIPFAFGSYILAFHSLLPPMGGGIKAVVLPTSAVWLVLFFFGLMRIWATPSKNHHKCKRKM